MIKDERAVNAMQPFFCGIKAFLNATLCRAERIFSGGIAGFVC